MACYDSNRLSIREVIAHLQLDPEFQADFAERFVAGFPVEPPAEHQISNFTCSQCGEHLVLRYQDTMERHIFTCRGKEKYPSLLDKDTPQRLAVLKELKKQVSTKQGKAFVVTINQNKRVGLVAIMNVHYLSKRPIMWEAFVINHIVESIEIPHRSFYEDIIAVCLESGFLRRDFTVVLDGIILNNPQALKCGALLGVVEFMKTMANVVFNCGFEMRPPFNCSSEMIKELIAGTDAERIVAEMFQGALFDRESNPVRGKRRVIQNPFTESLLKKIVSLGSPREYALLKLLCITFGGFNFGSPEPANLQHFQENLKYLRAFLNPWYWTKCREKAIYSLQQVTDNWVEATVSNILLCGYSVTSNYAFAREAQSQRNRREPHDRSWLLSTDTHICDCGSIFRILGTEATKEALIAKTISVAPLRYLKPPFASPPDNLCLYTEEVEDRIIDEVLQHCSKVHWERSVVAAGSWGTKESGNELFKSGNYIEAIQVYKAGLVADGGNPLLLLNLASAYLSAGDTQNCLKFCREGSRAASEKHEDHLLIGALTLESVVLIKQENFTDAYLLLSTARKTKSIDAITAGIEELIGFVCVCLGKQEEALLHYEEASALVRTQRIEGKVSTLQAAILNRL